MKIDLCKLIEVKENEYFISSAIYNKNKNELKLSIESTNENFDDELRKNLEAYFSYLTLIIDYKNEENKIFLEVTERVDTKTEVTTEELYQLYKKIRDLGLVWTDVAKRNVGRLKKDNIVHWNTPLSPTDEALELKKYINAP